MLDKKTDMMEYRREIDGLRAIAVIPVIFFHANFEAFSGGFVGVDIFFVISGYLITSIILSEKEKGTFSLINFYERRARRILPALFLVMLASFILAWFWLVPSDMKDFSKSIVAVSTFTSNILFWRETGYWGTANDYKPLLHTWSLAVEEQFYILFPIFLILMWRFRMRWILSSFLIIATISLLIAHWGAYNHPRATFFLLPTRSWELAIGASIAFYFMYKKRFSINLLSNELVNEAMGLVGLLMIAYAITEFNETVPFPSLYALVPTVGTGLIILYSSPQTVVGRLLGTKPLIGVGLISYSAYLWHQPLFGFSRYRHTSDPSDVHYVGLAMLSIMLAYLSWRYVEKPFRTKGVFSRNTIFTYAVLGSVLFIIIGLIGRETDGFESRYSLPVSVKNSFSFSDHGLSCFQFDNVHIASQWKCEIGDASTNHIKYFVVGDSHALSLFDAVDNAGKVNNIKGNFSGVKGCIPLLGVHSYRKDQDQYNCNAFNKRVYEFVQSSNIDLLILVARWTYYTDGGYDGNEFSYIGLSENGKKSKSISREAFKVGLKETIAAYNQLGVKVSVIRQIPEQRIHPQSIYYRAYEKDDQNEVITSLSVNREDHDLLQAYVDSIFDNATRNQVLWNYHDLTSVLCNEKCLVGSMDESFYHDADHLSIAGSNHIEKEFNEILLNRLTK
jgi:peptidoglycan/LPS O-acetylase OafA/YrhL